MRLLVDYANMAAKEHALLNRIEAATSEEERTLLEELSTRNQYVATLLPIRTVGVQVLFWPIDLCCWRIVLKKKFCECY